MYQVAVECSPSSKAKRLLLRTVPPVVLRPPHLLACSFADLLATRTQDAGHPPVILLEHLEVLSSQEWPDLTSHSVRVAEAAEISWAGAGAGGAGWWWRGGGMG